MSGWLAEEQFQEIGTRVEIRVGTLGRDSRSVLVFLISGKGACGLQGAVWGRRRTASCYLG